MAAATTDFLRSTCQSDRPEADTTRVSVVRPPYKKVKKSIASFAHETLAHAFGCLHRSQKRRHTYRPANIRTCMRTWPRTHTSTEYCVPVAGCCVRCVLIHLNLRKSKKIPGNDLCEFEPPGLSMTGCCYNLDGASVALATLLLLRRLWRLAGVYDARHAIMCGHLTVFRCVWRFGACGQDTARRQMRRAGRRTTRSHRQHPVSFFFLLVFGEVGR